MVLISFVSAPSVISYLSNAAYERIIVVLWAVLWAGAAAQYGRKVTHVQG